MPANEAREGTAGGSPVTMTEAEKNAMIARAVHQVTDKDVTPEVSRHVAAGALQYGGVADEAAALCKQCGGAAMPVGGGPGYYCPACLAPPVRGLPRVQA